MANKYFETAHAGLRFSRDIFKCLYDIEEAFEGQKAELWLPESFCFTDECANFEGDDIYI